MYEMVLCVQTAQPLLRRGYANPGFSGHELKDKPDPEGGAEKFARVQTRERTGGEEETDDRANRGHRKTHGKSTDHPFTVEGDFPAPRVPVGFAQSKEKEASKQGCSRGLIETSNRRHGETHDQSANADNGSATQENEAVPAMPLQMAGTNRGAELKRSKNHKEESRDDMDQGQERIMREQVIESIELRKSGVRSRSRGAIAVNDCRPELHDSTDGDSASDEGQKDNGAPKHATKSAPRLH